MKDLGVVRAADLGSAPQEERWLVEGLWGAEAVGFIAGEPKCCKSFMALALAVSVASGRPCLERFEVRRQGAALLYAAEDSAWTVRERLEGLCARHGLALADLPLFAITAPSFRG